jgi:site-specific DNA recombinase
MNIGLCRISSVSQKDNSSIPHQKKMIGDYCKVYDIELNEIIEECYSGKTSDRDGLNHLRELVNGGKVESVIVMKLDRLMRSFTEGVVFIKYLMDNDVKIVSVMEQIDTSSVNGRFLINILLSVSDLERTTIENRCLSGKSEGFLNKKKVCGRIPYGYEKRNGIISPNSEETKIVQYIYKKYLSLKKRGLTPIKRMKKLRQLLEMNGYKYRGKVFTTHNINYILKNGFYCGVMTYGDMTSKHKYETIISTKLYNLIQK